MKAKYIIAALEAMRDAERLNYSTAPEVFGKVLANLAGARIDLQVNSGLNDVAIEVDKVAA